MQEAYYNAAGIKPHLDCFYESRQLASIVWQSKFRLLPFLPLRPRCCHLFSRLSLYLTFPPLFAFSPPFLPRFPSIFNWSTGRGGKFVLSIALWERKLLLMPTRRSLSWFCVDWQLSAGFEGEKANWGFHLQGQLQALKLPLRARKMMQRKLFGPSQWCKTFVWCIASSLIARY